MSIEQIEQRTEQPVTPATPAPATPARKPPFEPPTWLTIGLALAYVVALAALAFLPGATMIERLRALDGGICAQNPTHSFFIDGQQLPLCSRNTGIYLGFDATFLALWVMGRLRAASFPGRWVMLVLAVAVVFMAEDGFNSFFRDLGLPYLYTPFNPLRLFTGLGTGVAMCAIIVPVANTLIWRDEDERSSFRSLKQLAVMIPILLLLFLAVISQQPFLLYPIALLSSFGLVMALTLVNTVFLLGVTNRVWRFSSWRAFLPFFTVAVILAILELMALFAAKTAVLTAITRG